MKKRSFHSEKHQTKPKKQYIKKFRFYPYFLYSHLDKWLKKISLNGYHIVNVGLFTFIFEKGTPQEREYFTYGLSTVEGKYDLSLRFPFLERTYGRKKSKINSIKNKTYQIVEIDTNKIDIENDVGYRELINDRNRLYMQYFIRNTSVITAVVLLHVILQILET